MGTKKINLLFLLLTKIEKAKKKMKPSLTDIAKIEKKN